MSDKLRDQETPNVLGYDLHRDSLTPIHKTLDTSKPGDYGCDPLGNEQWRMVPSGDIVDRTEMNRRLNPNRS